jgi:hypothetical protein
VGPILLVVGPAERRILILRIVRNTTAMTVRQPVGLKLLRGPAGICNDSHSLWRRPTTLND